MDSVAFHGAPSAKLSDHRALLLRLLERLSAAAAALSTKRILQHIETNVNNLLTCGPHRTLGSSSVILDCTGWG